MEIEPYETEFFYDKYGLKIWEKRHSKVLKIISKINGVQKVPYNPKKKLKLFYFIVVRFGLQHRKISKKSYKRFKF